MRRPRAWVTASTTTPRVASPATARRSSSPTRSAPPPSGSPTSPPPYDPPDFTVGEEVNLVGSGPIRYMYNPSLAGDSNCYSSQHPEPGGARGGRPGQPLVLPAGRGHAARPTASRPARPATASSVTGVGIQKAEQIMYNAMLMKTSSSSYLKYRTWTLTAAKNLDATCGLFNATKAAWNAVSVPAQTGDPTCTGGGGTNTVTVNNPGSKTGTVGTAASLQMTGTDSQSGQTLHLVGDRPARGPVDQLLDRSDQRHADDGRHLHADRQGDRHHRGVRRRRRSPGRSAVAAVAAAPARSSATPASRPVRRHRGPRRPASSTARPSEPAHSGSWKAWLDGYGTTHTDTLSQSVTIPAGCGSDAVVLAAHRHGGDDQHDGVRQADGQGRRHDAGDVLEPEPQTPGTPRSPSTCRRSPVRP